MENVHMGTPLIPNEHLTESTRLLESVFVADFFLGMLGNVVLARVSLRYLFFQLA